MKVARRGGVPPFIVMDVLREANARAAAGERILHLEVGQPGDPAPTAAREAAAQAAREMRLGYTDALGTPGLRTRIAKNYAEVYGCALDAERIVAAAGSSGAFMLAFLAAFDVGDRVALAAPGYPAYRNILTALGLETVSIPADAADGFQPTPATLDRLNPKPDGLIVASPANPTGAMLSPSALAALADWCAAHAVRLISDEIYHGVVFPGAPPQATAAALSETAVVVNSVSKYHGMTGWRIGWAVAPPDLVRPMERLAQNLFIAPSAIGQVAAEAAFDARAELDAR
ncbi:MAG: aminotransferase class I/II-fold pyridoxal phosphate-dependent enzyme, partial [Pseudomonadota bacterium]